MLRTCSCGTTFKPDHHLQRYCAPTCRPYKYEPRKRDPKGCAGCGRTFTPTHGNQGRCERCRDLSRIHALRECPACGNEFVARSARHRFCSKSCSNRGREQAPTERACNGCGEMVPNRRGPRVYCEACKTARDSGPPLNIWAHFAKWQPCMMCSFPFRPKRRGQEYCSRDCGRFAALIRHTRDCSRCGNCWQPSKGSRSQASTLCWDCRKRDLVPGGKVYAHIKSYRRAQLIEREDGRCQDCGATAEDAGEPLHAHHVVPRSRGGSNALDNLKLLCPDCHVGSGWERHHHDLALAGFVAPRP